MASGAVIALLGLWILLRTISSGSGGNLSDWLLGLGGSSAAAGSKTKGSAAPSSPAPSAPGHIATAGQPVPNLGGIGHRNTP